MAEKLRQIIPIGGGGFYRDPENLELEKYIIERSGECAGCVHADSERRARPLRREFLCGVFKARLSAVSADFFQTHTGIALFSAQSGRDLCRRRQHEKLD